MFLKHEKKVNQIELPTSIDVGEGLYIVHGEVHLNAEYIGKNCTFYQGVTVGTGKKGSKERPYLGDGVTIYTGAVVSGNVRVGKGAIICANSVVIDDIDPDTMVSVVPAKIIKKVI